LAQLAANGPAV